MLSFAFSTTACRSSIVAKIYDDVDYTLSTSLEGTIDDGTHGELDCMTCADQDYSVETHAYSNMQLVIGGTIVPAYYHGSWTFAQDTNQPDQRRLRHMILVELIQGECKRDIIRRAETGLIRSTTYPLAPTARGASASRPPKYP
jgi:hypothetical protein